MQLTMSDSRVSTIQEVSAFLKGSDGLKFKTACQAESYLWIERVLIQFGYHLLNKPEKAIVKQYLKKLTGYSRSQITRLISQHTRTGKVRLKSFARQRFALKYSISELTLLAGTDELHDFPNGNALKAILNRMAYLYGQKEYLNLANISPAHIYNLRKSAVYQRLTKQYQKTKPRVVNIGERRKPEPNGKPGYLRVDTVHQGDQDGKKGVYHVNVADEVTQFQFVGGVEKISERYLIPILEILLELYPFIIIEFHSDNGSEFINSLVVELLNKLLVKQTKSRSRKTNDNALIESKNGSVIRKWLGYQFMPSTAAMALNEFYFDYFHEYLNYHRPCAFATTIADRKGKQKKIYKPSDYQTPYEKLKNLTNAKQYLKPGISFKKLDAIAMRYTDNQMARIVQQQRSILFDKLNQSL